MINEHIELGVLNTLKVNRITEPGIYLEAQDEEVVLLPNAYTTNEMLVDDEIEVFIYTDSEDRLIATTQNPYGMKDQFMFTRVVDILPFGAFVEWGLLKDLFVPKNRQKVPFKEGENKIVRVVQDDETSRLIGVEKITSFLNNRTEYLTRNDVVDLLVFAKTPMGYKVIVDNKHEGMIFKNEVFTDINYGDTLTGYIKNIREDGKLDISLQPIGKEESGDVNTKKILDVLSQNNNDLPYNYKTDATIVKDMFSMSKKAYKRALTKLIEENTIKLDDEGMSKV
ncbi:MAG: S1-like domain-containing RNA-binding protein [Campylobacterota bacterium]|nr:S1-like domain-containing RNA-binding protein [Campylobacterota bacterium]